MDNYELGKLRHEIAEIWCSVLRCDDTFDRWLNETVKLFRDWHTKALDGLNPEGIPELVRAATRAVGNPADGTYTCYCSERGDLGLTGRCWCCELKAALAKVKKEGEG